MSTTRDLVITLKIPMQVECNAKGDVVGDTIPSIVIKREIEEFLKVLRCRTPVAVDSRLNSPIGFIELGESGLRII